MTRRLLGFALACAALYAILLGTGAAAQDPTPTPSETPAPDQSAIVVVNGVPSTATPTPTPVATVVAPAATAAVPPATEAPATTTPATTTPAPAAAPTEAPATAPAAPAAPASTPAAAPEKGIAPETTATPTPTAVATPEAQQGERYAAPADSDADLLPDDATACELAAAAAKDSTSDRGSDERTCDKPAKRKHRAARKAHDGKAADKAADAKPQPAPVTPAPAATRRADGVPTAADPTYTQVQPGAAAIGVPNFFIEKFRIPPFLLPIYQAAGMQYNVRWEILAAINEIETDYGRNLNVSSAGALGWMQFMPATWQSYGVDANKDGQKDPYNPVDAIFAAARYLRAAGAEQDIRRAIFAYNHADWYVDSVLLRAQVIGGLPSNFVGSLTGLTQARFPVWAKATYADELNTAKASRRMRSGNAAVVVDAAEARRAIRIFAREGAPVIAVNDGRIVKVGENERLGRFVQLQDVYGNTFTYGHLGEVSETYPYPKQRRVSPDKVTRELALPAADRAPERAASSTTAPAAKRAAKVAKTVAPATRPAPAVATKDRLFANPARPRARAAGGEEQLQGSSGDATFDRIAGGPLEITSKHYVARTLRPGARVLAGTILGRIGKTTVKAPHVLFEIRPAGRGAPRIDPKPILDGWKLLESTAIYRAAGKNPFFGKDADQPTIGQILLMGKETLVRRVLHNPRIDVYGCGRDDVRTGQIDRRVLATLEFLAASGLRPTVTSLKCGHGVYTTSGNVSEHSSGNAVDIAAVNGIPIIGHQGPGSITDITIQRLLTMQGTLEPHQIISLMTYEDAPNTYAMADHHDHIHVGWRPLFGTNSKAAKQVNAVLRPKQWIKLIDRLNNIDNPVVREQPSKYSVKVTKRASRAHRGD